MYDSVTPSAIPRNAEMVAGYIDGNINHIWSAGEWALFPQATKVRIARVPENNDGHVLDIEYGVLGGEWPPGPRMVEWVKRRRKAGVTPTIYCNQLNDWKNVRQQFISRGVPEPLYWVARYNNVKEIPAGAIAKQYANAPLLGFNADASIVADFWPGVDGETMALTDDDIKRLWAYHIKFQSLPENPGGPAWMHISNGNLAAQHSDAKLDELITAVSELRQIVSNLVGQGVTLTAEGQITIKGDKSN